MTEAHKKLAIIGGTVLIALLILLFMPRKSSGETVINRAPFNLGDVTIPGFDMSPRDPIIFPILPGLGGDDSAVIGSACCATCDHSGPSYYIPAPIYPAQQTTFNIQVPRAAPAPRARSGSSASFMQAPVPFITQWIGGLW
jgi:hypothetical protein